MKRCALLLSMLVLLAAPRTAHTQSLAETERWLNARLEESKFHHTYVSTLTDVWLENFFSYEDDVGTRQGAIRWRGITSVNAQKTAKGNVIIVLTGPAEIRHYDPRTRQIIRTEPARSITLWLRASADGERIAKGLRHMATLKGAKIVNDDLFHE